MFGDGEDATLLTYLHVLKYIHSNREDMKRDKETYCKKESTPLVSCPIPEKKSLTAATIT